MIVFGSRGSRLALWQTNHVADSIKAATGEDFRVEVIETSGDRVLDQPLAEIGIKGLFTRELTDDDPQGRHRETRAWVTTERPRQLLRASSRTFVGSIALELEPAGVPQKAGGARCT